MPNDPSYVRLANRLTRGIVADIGNSGWSISGFDVKPFPKDDEAAARFVRRELRDGKLEPASKAEHEEVTETHKKALGDSSHQEAKLQRAAREANAKLAESRGVDDDDDDEEDYLADVEERLKGQKEDETDDPAEQVARNSARAAKKKKSKTKTKAKATVEE